MKFTNVTSFFTNVTLIFTLLIFAGCGAGLHNTENEFFDYSTGRLADGTRARASSVNTILDEIETGLDKLPTEAQLKLGLIQYGTEAGAADAYVITMPYTPTSYTDGMTIMFKASATNTGASTVNVDSLGVKSITTQDGTALSAGDITANYLYTIVYNSTSGKFEIQNFISYAAIAALESTVSGLSAGSGVLVSSNDTTLGYLNGKLTAGEGIDLTEGSDGGNETLSISGEDASTSNKGIASFNTDDFTVAAGVVSSKIDIVEDLTPQLGGELDAQAHTVGFTLQTATGDGTTTIDWKLGNKFKFTFGAFNETFTFTAPTKPGSFTLVLIQDGVGSRTATWPTIKWSNATAPTLSTAASSIDIVTLFYDGTSWYGMGANGFATP